MDRLIAIALRLGVADGFDYPVGPPDAAGYYDAQPFGGASAHLGADWNGVGGGDSDLGDPVFAVGDGRVSEAVDHGGGWGNVVRVMHLVREDDGARIVESLYAHLERIDVRAGQRVARGQQLGTIGTADGVYRAHLHFEVRATAGRPLGLGYGPADAQVDPSAFIDARRVSRRRSR